MDPVVIVTTARLDQQHPVGRVGAQTVSQQAAGRAGPDDDVIKLVLPVCIVVIGHGLSPGLVCVLLGGWHHKLGTGIDGV